MKEEEIEKYIITSWLIITLACLIFVLVIGSNLSNHINLVIEVAEKIIK